jgi:spore germination protein KB
MYKTISPKVWCFVMTLVFMANVVIIGVDKIAGRDSWICAIIASVLYIPVFIIYAHLTKLYPGKNFFGIMSETLGKWASKTAAAIYTVYGVLLLSMSLNGFARFIATNILPDTPELVMVALLALCAFFFVCKNSSVIGKWSCFMLPLVIISILVAFFSSIKSMYVENLMPILEKPEILLDGTYRYLAFPFAEPIIGFALLSSVRGKIKLYQSLLPWIISTAIVVMTFIRNTAVLGGSLAGMLAFNTYFADSIVGYISFSQRIEVLTTLTPAVAGIAEAAVILMFATQGADFLTSGKISRFSAAGITFAAVILTAILYPSFEALHIRVMVWPIVSVPLQVVFPVACLAAHGMKNRVKGKLRHKKRVSA